MNVPGNDAKPDQNVSAQVPNCNPPVPDRDEIEFSSHSACPVSEYNDVVAGAPTTRQTAPPLGSAVDSPGTATTNDINDHRERDPTIEHAIEVLWRIRMRGANYRMALLVALSDGAGIREQERGVLEIIARHAIGDRNALATGSRKGDLLGNADQLARVIRTLPKIAAALRRSSKFSAELFRDTLVPAEVIKSGARPRQTIELWISEGLLSADVVTAAGFIKSQIFPYLPGVSTELDNNIAIPLERIQNDIRHRLKTGAWAGYESHNNELLSVAGAIDGIANRLSIEFAHNSTPPPSTVLSNKSTSRIENTVVDMAAEVVRLHTGPASTRAYKPVEELILFIPDRKKQSSAFAVAVLRILYEAATRKPPEVLSVKQISQMQEAGTARWETVKKALVALKKAGLVLEPIVSKGGHQEDKRWCLNGPASFVP